MSNNNAELMPFEVALDREWPVCRWASVSVLVAVSGGPDSVALLRAAARLRQQHPEKLGVLHVAHFNHGWRGTASQQDASFVQDLSRQLSLPYHVGRSASSQKKEELARSERYAFLQQTAERIGARYLALAHNANDQAETILHRIIRGTALRGLAGIPARRTLGAAVTICRPMLEASRETVLAYLHDIGQPFRLDASNTDTSYTRNRIRHELLPLLETEYNPAVASALLKLGQLAAEANRFVDEQVELRMSTCIRAQSTHVVEIDRSVLLAQPLYLQKQMLISAWRGQGWPEQSMGFDQWDQLIHAVDTATTTCLPGNIRVTTMSDAIRLTRFES